MLLCIYAMLRDAGLREVSSKTSQFAVQVNTSIDILRERGPPALHTYCMAISVFGLSYTFSSHKPLEAYRQQEIAYESSLGTPSRVAPVRGNLLLTSTGGGGGGVGAEQGVRVNIVDAVKAQMKIMEAKAQEKEK